MTRQESPNDLSRTEFVAVAVLTRGELGLFALPWWLRDPIVIESPL